MYCSISLSLSLFPSLLQPSNKIAKRAFGFRKLQPSVKNAIYVIQKHQCSREPVLAYQTGPHG